jgi:hypothetical protein
MISATLGTFLKDASDRTLRLPFGMKHNCALIDDVDLMAFSADEFIKKFH